MGTKLAPREGKKIHHMKVQRLWNHQTFGSILALCVWMSHVFALKGTLMRPMKEKDTNCKIIYSYTRKSAPHVGEHLRKHGARVLSGYKGI